MHKFALITLTMFLSAWVFAQTRVLHYDETTGFDHNTRSASVAFFATLGSALGFTVTQDSDGSEFTQANLANFDLVVFSNTSGDNGLTASQRSALEWFVDVNGGHLLGIHAATDTYRHSTANGSRTGTWDWYAETLGGSVQQNPNHTSNSYQGTIIGVAQHPSTANITLPWTKREEYYYWENGYLNTGNAGINAVLDVQSTGSQSYDAQRPVAWTRTAASGSRIFYTSLGHFATNFTGGFPQFEQLIEDAAIWALGSALPVTLTSFTAEARPASGEVALKWVTASEQNADRFEVQRSGDGVLFATIGGVAAAGDTDTERDYSYTDGQARRGTTYYYRLRQVDRDGSVEYSPTVSVWLATEGGLRVGPNPGADWLTVRPGGRSFEVHDERGRLVYASASCDDLCRVSTLGWRVGVYVVTARMSGGNVETVRWVKSE